MHDFGKLVYLDVQKTGSTLISAFLRRACVLEEVSFLKHGHVTDADMRNAEYFISVREPYFQYLSLFKYGCEKKGDLFQRFEREGLDEVYDATEQGFVEFLDIFLDERRFLVLDRREADLMDKFGFGFQTLRHLLLSFNQPYRTLDEIDDFEQLECVYDELRLHKFVVLQERLLSDLAHLANHCLPKFFDKKKTQAFLEMKLTFNSTVNVPIRLTSVSTNKFQALKDKECFLYKKFYPEVATN